MSESKKPELEIVGAGNVVWFRHDNGAAPRHLIHGEFAIVTRSVEGGIQSYDNVLYFSRQNAERALEKRRENAERVAAAQQAVNKLAEDNHDGDATTAVVPVG